MDILSEILAAKAANSHGRKLHLGSHKYDALMDALSRTAYERHPTDYCKVIYGLQIVKIFGADQDVLEVR